MLRVGSVVPGACAVAILWRLSGDEDGPLRTSPNLSLRWFFSSHVWDRVHVWTHALVTVSLLLWLSLLLMLVVNSTIELEL